MFRNNDLSDGGRLVLVEAPDQDVLALSDLKKAIGITGTSSDLVLTAALAAVCANLDASTGGWLGRALRPQTWELQLQSFLDRRCPLRPYNNQQAIPLPLPPFIDVISVQYLDVNGVNQTLVENTDFRVLPADSPLGQAAISPLYNASWPTARKDDASVRIRFEAGYDDDVNMTPPQLISAICLGVRALLPLMQRDVMLMEDRVEGVGWKRYQNNALYAQVLDDRIASLLASLRVG